MASSVTIQNGKEIVSPPTLFEKALYEAWKNKFHLLVYATNETTDVRTLWRLKPAAHLPSLMWSELLEFLNKYYTTDKYLPLLFALRQESSTFLQRIFVSNSFNLSDEDLLTLMSGSSVTSLDIHNCPNLTKKTFHTINTFGSNLVELKIGISVNILPEDKNLSERTVLETPKLKTLTIWGAKSVPSLSYPRTRCVTWSLDYLQLLLKTCVSSLEHLDLSGISVPNLSFLENAAENLKYLQLEDVLVDYNENNTWNILKSLKRLRFLGISYVAPSKAPRIDSPLLELIQSLPKLTDIDIFDSTVFENEACTVNFWKKVRPLNFLSITAFDDLSMRIAQTKVNHICSNGSMEWCLNTIQYCNSRFASSDKSMIKLKLAFEALLFCLPEVEVEDLFKHFLKRDEESNFPFSKMAIYLALLIIRNSSKNITCNKRILMCVFEVIDVLLRNAEKETQLDKTWIDLLFSRENGKIQSFDFENSDTDFDNLDESNSVEFEKDAELENLLGFVRSKFMQY